MIFSNQKSLADVVYSILQSLFTWSHTYPSILKFPSEQSAMGSLLIMAMSPWYSEPLNGEPNS